MPIERIVEKLHVSETEAELILKKAIAGGEVASKANVDDWIDQRLLPNCVFINENEYARMCIDALKILEGTAATDYGSSRQRDLGQMWADMTRGYLGEIALIKFLQDRFNIDCTLGHEQGRLQDYLPSDIHKIKKAGESFREPRLKIGIKTSKWNGIWLDLPGDQFSHSDIHIFVKVGTGRDHLFSFFKHISVFKDKVLSKGVEVGALSEDEAQTLYDNLPSFTPIPAYICGFIKKEAHYENLSYTGKKGRIHYKILTWNGPIHNGDLQKIRESEQVHGNVRFESIGEFSHDSGYLFNTGNLLWSAEDWRQIVEQF